MRRTKVLARPAIRNASLLALGSILVTFWLGSRGAVAEVPTIDEIRAAWHAGMPEQPRFRAFYTWEGFQIDDATGEHYQYYNFENKILRDDQRVRLEPYHRYTDPDGSVIGMTHSIRTFDGNESRDINLSNVHLPSVRRVGRISRGYNSDSFYRLDTILIYNRVQSYRGGLHDLIGLPSAEVIGADKGMIQVRINSVPELPGFFYILDCDPALNFLPNRIEEHVYNLSEPDAPPSLVSVTSDFEYAPVEGSPGQVWLVAFNYRPGKQTRGRHHRIEIKEIEWDPAFDEEEFTIEFAEGDHVIDVDTGLSEILGDHLKTLELNRPEGQPPITEILSQVISEAAEASTNDEASPHPPPSLHVHVDGASEPQTRLTARGWVVRVGQILILGVIAVSLLKIAGHMRQRKQGKRS